MMTLDNVVPAIGKPYWLDYPDLVLRAGAGWVPSKAESATIVQRFVKELDTHHEGRATNWAVLGVCLDADRFIAAMKREGHLRATRRGYSDRTVYRVVKALSGAALPLSPAITDYLRSVLFLHDIGSQVKKIHDELVAVLRKLKHTALKGAIASADLLFMVYQTRGLHSDPSLDSTYMQAYSPEELVEGFSFLFFKYVEIFGWPVHNSILNPRAARSGEYMSLLQACALIRRFHDMEVMIDGLDYRLEKTNSNEYRLNPPSPEFERAYRYGFMQTESQTALNFHEMYNPDHLSLKSVIEKLGAPIKSRFFKLVKEPFERFTCAFFVEGPVKELLDDSGLFQEEAIFIHQACRELMTQEEDLLGFEVTAGITLWDLLRVQRFINYIRWHTAAYLLPELAARPGVVFQSIVPHFTDEVFKNLLGQVIDPNKVRPLLDLLVWRPDSSRVFDVQYQPVIRTSNGYLLPLNVFGGSNLLRNVLQLTKRRLYTDGKHDPLPPWLKRILLERTRCVDTEVRFSRGERTGDIDVMAFWENKLFAFECKNSLLPAGPYELRTSYDYVRTASDQLDRFRHVFADPAYRTQLASALEQRTGIAWPINETTQLVTCIVMANRMFMGYRLGRNGVRGSFELVGFINEGTHRMGDETKCLWAGSTMTAEDLRAFIEDDTVYQLVWAAMEPYEQEHLFGSVRVVWPSWRMQPRRLAELLGFTKTAAAIADLEAKETEKKRQAQADIDLAVAKREFLRRYGH